MAIESNPRLNRTQAAIFAGVMAIVATVVVVAIFAAGTPVAFEAEVGARSGSASLVADPAASGGSAVKFSGTSAFVPNCIASPHVCGYPDATNTGVPAGTALVSVPSGATSGTGWTWDANNQAVLITTAGAVVSGLNVAGGIEAHANNITIKNSKITGCTYYPVDYGNDGQYSGLVVQDTEINPGCISGTACLSFSNYTAVRINCTGAVDGFKGNTNVVVQDSYIHDVQFNSGTHNDGIQSTGGGNVKFVHNTCDMGTAGDCIQFSADSNWTVTGNLVRATGWMFNGGTPNNSTFTGNRFVNKAATGAFGYASLPGTGNTWSNNIRDDDGSAVSN